MRSQTRFFVTGLALVILSNCTGPEDGLVARKTTTDNINLAQAAAAPATPVLSVPTSGSATYVGVMAANVTGSYTGSLYADLSMTVDFAPGGAITGQITRSDLIDDFGNTVENLDGTLTVSGGQAGGGIAASATGTLTGTKGPVIGAGVANYGLLGTVRSDATTADTVYGSVTGKVTGNFNLDLSAGEFYGKK